MPPTPVPTPTHVPACAVPDPAPGPTAPHPPLTLALWQTPYAAPDDPAPGPAVLAQRLAALDATAAQARAAGADLLLTPEMALTGYHRDPDWLRHVAQAADGPWAQTVAALARRHGVAVVYGYPEAAAGGALPYNAVQAIGPDGRALAQYRKTHLFGALDAARFSPGVPLAPDSTDTDPARSPWVYRGWRLGLLVCYDVEFTGPVQALATQGADAVLVPTANMPEYDQVQQHTLPAQARTHRLALVYANACGAERGLAYGGLSTAVGPQGQVWARAGRGPQLLVVALPSADSQPREEKST